jgi:hypothetical protein
VGARNEMAKDYPNSEIFEKAYIVWLFHKPELREKYLEQTLPATFLDPTKRIIIFAMKKLTEQKVEITVPNLVLYITSNDQALENFLRKHKSKRPDESVIYSMIYDTEISASPDLFEQAKKYIINYAFARYVQDRITDIQYQNARPGQNNNIIVGACRSIIKVHDILNGRIETKRNQLEETMSLVNATDEYVRTSSQKLNSLIGGWTRGYIATLIAKSGHTKSTWIDYDTVQSLLSGKISSASIISPEESASTRWRRIIAMICKIPTTAMRQKTALITEENIKHVKEILADRLFIYDEATKYKEVLELMNSIKTDKIVIDHLQAIDYPGTGDFLMRMIGNIPAVIDFEKRQAKQRHQVIINLSQVNDKEIQRSERLIKAPRYWDAYGSSVLYQASREFLALWYPYKDQDDNAMGIQTGNFSVNDIRMSVEKSSFTSIGKVKLLYNPEYATFMDAEHVKNQDYTPPEEKGLFE